MRTRNEGGVNDKDRPFGVRSERTGTEERISVRGEIDMSVTPELERELRRAEEAGAPEIVLDLDRLEFLDVAGVRLLLDLKTRSDESGRRLRITGASSPHVRRVLEVTGATSVLSF